MNHGQRVPRHNQGAVRGTPECGDAAFDLAHACKMGLEGIVSKRKDSAYRSGRSPDWLKMKNPAAPAVKREAEEDWGR
jgi:ATP-dependent DNA ligase